MTEILKERASTGCKVLRTRNHGRQLLSRRTQKVKSIYNKIWHKFFRFVHVTGQEAFEENSDVNEGGTALIRPSGCRPEGLFYGQRPEDCECNPIGRPQLNEKKNSKSSQPELSGRALCMELCDLWSCLETVKIMYTAQQRTHMDVRARRQRHGRR